MIECRWPAGGTRNLLRYFDHWRARALKSCCYSAHFAFVESLGADSEVKSCKPLPTYSYDRSSKTGLNHDDAS